MLCQFDQQRKQILSHQLVFLFTDDSLSSTSKQGDSLAMYSDISDVENDDSDYEEESGLYNYP